MTLRQRFLKLLQPLFSAIARHSGRHGLVLRNPGATPRQSIYALSVPLGNGAVLPLETLRGRKILLVNTASDCIYTGQYAGLQELADRYGERLQVIAFPSNEFKEQEQDDDAGIAGFCQVNYGVRFPIAHKALLKPGPGQQDIYRWLTDKSRNGWNDEAPGWNFGKYLIDENGSLTHYFGPAVMPDERDLT